jgi:endonuclease/exonuclease/phosphatase family metal-dependent hydrolase
MPGGCTVIPGGRAPADAAPLVAPVASPGLLALPGFLALFGLIGTPVGPHGLSAAVPPGGSTSAAPATARPAPADTLRVLVYNIHAGKDAAGEGNLERVAGLIRETGADLVLLQEVDRGTRRSGGVDQLAVLERRTGRVGAFGKTLDYQGGEYGIAVLSRWPVARDTLIRLPVEPAQVRAGGSREPRGVLRVRVDAPSGRLEVLNTHLDASPDGAHRRQEVETVLRVAEELRAGEAAVLIGGDLNAEPGSPTVGRLAGTGWVDGWRACGEGDGRTYPADEPSKRIDYLFLEPGGSCAAARVLATEASDHRPLLVVVPGS